MQLGMYLSSKKLQKKGNKAKQEQCMSYSPYDGVKIENEARETLSHPRALEFDGSASQHGAGKGCQAIET